MKKMIILFLCLGIAVMGFSSCGEKEKELEAKESKLGEELGEKRKRLNEVVRSVDELETVDYSEKLVEVNLKLDALTRELEFEKTELKKLSAEKREFVKKLEDYRKKYSMGED
ncbi:MAG TPA: hypothetical protein DDW68_11820 [Verrucomicrobiales bacterium]|nr:hypothetical protein [Verrucomicrobiales bacterium]HBE97848.1 hypothetical protein [Verrucomicrobiales bacterium]|tara:strand:+ start:146 stop:484 length:339 start_codon:yes stop_codon:yes gene_type:complete